MKELTREQRAVYQFNQGASTLRPVAEMDVAPNEYMDFYDGFTSGVSRFITSELFHRQADRCKIMSIQKDLEKYSRESGEEANIDGIEALKLSSEALEKFIGQQKLPVGNQQFDKAIKKFGSNLRNLIVTLEIKASDAAELNEVVSMVEKTMSGAEGPANVLKTMQSKMKELIEVRSSAGRGAETNIAVWKLLAAAVLLLVAAWAIVKCYYTRWRCSQRELAIYNSVMALALILFGACE